MRYFNKEVFKNARAAYKRYLKARGLEHVSQYNTPQFKYPSPADAANFSTVKHIWGTGDRYFKLANQYYGRPELWWIIARYNGAPTEASLKRGDVVLIPTPIETILHYL